MSYSNPRWYGIGNPQAFTDAFQKSFNTQYANAIEYYEAKSKDLEEYNDSLELKAERQRQAILKSKNVTADMIKQAEQAAQDFLKESRTVSKDTDVFGAPKLIKKTKAEIDAASSAFSASAKTAGDIADIVYSEKIDLEKDLDKGGLYYDPLLKVKRALDNGNYEFKYDKDNKYSFKVKTEDGKVLDQDDLQMIIAGNDPKARKRIDEAWDETVVKVYGSTMTDLNNAITAGYASRDSQGKAVYQEKYIDEMLDSTIANMSNKTKDEFYNNELDSISDEAIKAKILKQSGGKLLIDTAQEIDTKNKNNNSKEALSMLLDIPLNNVSERKRLIKEVLGEARFNEMSMEDKNSIDEALSTYKSKAVREGLKQELKAKGLKSKYIDRKAPRISPRISREIEAQDAFNKYAEQKGLETANTINTAISTIANPEKERSLGFGSLFGERKKGGDYEIYKDDIEIDKIKVGGSVKEVRDVELSKDGKLSLVYDATTVKGSPVQDAVTYNIYDPASMRDFYSASSVQSVTGEKAMKLYSDLYDREMVKNYTTEQGLIALDNADMIKWFDFVYRKATDLQKQTILNYEFSNPVIRDMQDDFKIDYKTARTSN